MNERMDRQRETEMNGRMDRGERHAERQTDKVVRLHAEFPDKYEMNRKNYQTFWKFSTQIKKIFFVENFGLILCQDLGPNVIKLFMSVIYKFS
jgi:hypothetical protein